MAVSTPAAVRVWGSNWALYRHMWHADAAGNLLQPLLYLLGMGIGVGALVDSSGRSDTVLDGVSYLAFLAPALIATTAMMTSATEALWPLLAGFKWTNQFLAMTATPLRPVDVVGGFALWVATRAVDRVDGGRRGPRAVRRHALVGTTPRDRVRGAHRPGVRDAGGRVDVDP